MKQLCSSLFLLAHFLLRICFFYPCKFFFITLASPLTRFPFLSCVQMTPEIFNFYFSTSSFHVFPILNFKFVGYYTNKYTIADQFFFQVGEYMIFHIRSNYFIDKFSYLIISKGIILLTGDQDMGDYVSTMAIALSAEMAPMATIVVWHVGKYGDLQVDSLTFPVNGISRNKVSKN